MAVEVGEEEQWGRKAFARSNRHAAALYFDTYLTTIVNVMYKVLTKGFVVVLFSNYFVFFDFVLG